VLPSTKKSKPKLPRPSALCVIDSTPLWMRTWATCLWSWTKTPTDQGKRLRADSFLRSSCLASKTVSCLSWRQLNSSPSVSSLRSLTSRICWCHPIPYRISIQRRWRHSRSLKFRLLIRSNSVADVAARRLGPSKRSSSDLESQQRSPVPKKSRKIL
jgi:hypothetical protein